MFVLLSIISHPLGGEGEEGREYCVIMFLTKCSIVHILAVVNLFPVGSRQVGGAKREGGGEEGSYQGHWKRKGLIILVNNHSLGY